MHAAQPTHAVSASIAPETPEVLPASGAIGTYSLELKTMCSDSQPDVATTPASADTRDLKVAQVASSAAVVVIPRGSSAKAARGSDEAHANEGSVGSGDREPQQAAALADSQLVAVSDYLKSIPTGQAEKWWLARYTVA
ncbi:hypothetical protein PHYPSEUDO_013913 [Phytophthora pseudosyringae]|uniref:Uncharacterized protein n=1 Tax=Phytophthora pseudosyringae TaxID=221518 RepID=A0A8T1V9M6_9STRA|nr:hypothetical protein PHYPSEUDO_013913 [Phytophthora pseudosyringae]